jgi:hypothetical protein
MEKPAIILTFINLHGPMKTIRIILNCLLITSLSAGMFAQKAAQKSIRIEDLKKHMQFLASDELGGRNTGECGLEVAGRYLAVQAGYLELLKAPGSEDYFQRFGIIERSLDFQKSEVTVLSDDTVTCRLHDPFYVFPQMQSDSFSVEGEVVFAGYGIHDMENSYDDFEGIDIEGKIVLIMDQGPMNEAGDEVRFGEGRWSGEWSIRNKLPYIISQGARAILFVFDPKSGYRSLDEQSPAIAEYLKNSMTLEEEAGIRYSLEHLHTIIVNANVADQLLAGTGRSLESLQMEIDSTLVPRSFVLEDKSVRIRLVEEEKRIEQRNIFGWIEGSDPVLKDQIVIYLAHYDHIGTEGEGGIFNGADDNASGTVALLEIAEAFRTRKKAPPRSIGFLWVAGEEIGMLGSAYYASHPLIPLEKTCAVINLDMVGHTKTPEDVASNRKNLTIVGGDTVKVIGALQSKVLMKINQETLEQTGMTGNYSYNSASDPERYFYRSDHISFARKDIPVLYYSTGTHSDYHRVTDEEGRIDYNKFLKMTLLGYSVGNNIAGYPGNITVDNPMSGW